MSNVVHVANNYGRKIPLTSLNMRFSTAQQYFSFDDPKEKDEIMKLYNKRAQIKDFAKVKQKQASLAAHHLALLRNKQPVLPKVPDDANLEQRRSTTLK